MNGTCRRLYVVWIWLAGGLFCAPLLAEDVPVAPPAPPASLGAPVPDGPWVWTGDPAGLHQLSLCQLDELYRQAAIHAAPHGWMPGQVIVFTNLPAPKLIKKLADTFWLGKQIEPDGHFTNQWRKRQALASCIRIGPSYVDGQPALVFEYPWYTPLFGPMRDEYREIGPGLFLGRMYRRRPCVRFLGFNYMQLCEGGYSAPVGLPEAVVSPAPPAGADPSPGFGLRIMAPAPPE